MAAGDLTTLEAVRAYLTGSVPLNQDDDALLASLISSVSLMFTEKVDRNVISASATDTFSGDGRSWRYLEQYPVTSVSSVTVDGVALDARVSFSGTGWVMTDASAGRLDLVGYAFTTGVANCSVAYTAGLGAVATADIDQAVVDQVAFMYKAKDRIGITNQSIGGESVSFLGAWKAQHGEGGMTALFLATVERYRRVA